MHSKTLEELKEEFKTRIERKADYILKEVMMMWFDVEENGGGVDVQKEFMRIALDIINEKLVSSLNV